MPGNNSLSVLEYSHIVVKKYLQNAFSDNPQENLNVGAEELYVLLRKVKMASGDKNKSEDVKAPLKAVRDAIDQLSFASDNTNAYSTEVDKLFALLAQLEWNCQDRISRNVERDAALSVQQDLRYRLTRLVTGDTWDNRPELKLRVLKLMYSFAVHESERLAEESSREPSIKLSGGLGRTLSIGRRSSKDMTPVRPSKWQEALNEISRMPSTKLFQIMKCMLHDEKQRISGIMGVNLTNGIEIGAPSTPQQVPVDLLGVEHEAGAPVSVQRESAPSRHSSSPSPSVGASSIAPSSAAPTPIPDLFESLAGERRPVTAAIPVARQDLNNQFNNMSLSHPPYFGTSVGSPSESSASAYSYSRPPSGLQTPSGYQYAPGAAQYGLPPQHPGLSPQGSGTIDNISAFTNQWQDNAEKLVPHVPPPTSFDVNFPSDPSPYHGVVKPFDDTRFNDLNILPSRPAPPPTAAAPSADFFGMRADK